MTIRQIIDPPPSEQWKTLAAKITRKLKQDFRIYTRESGDLQDIPADELITKAIVEAATDYWLR